MALLKPLKPWVWWLYWPPSVVHEMHAHIRNKAKWMKWVLWHNKRCSKSFVWLEKGSSQSIPSQGQKPNWAKWNTRCGCKDCIPHHKQNPHLISVEPQPQCRVGLLTFFLGSSHHQLCNGSNNSMRSLRRAMKPTRPDHPFQGRPQDWSQPISSTASPYVPQLPGATLWLLG